MADIRREPQRRKLLTVRIFIGILVAYMIALAIPFIDISTMLHSSIWFP